ncbi:ABC transporter substrate-binding protein [Spirochaetia bacterium]|nr:ABC transporter substrate-binding protein [Spirochaetia bacterium]
MKKRRVFVLFLAVSLIGIVFTRPESAFAGGSKEPAKGGKTVVRVLYHISNQGAQTRALHNEFMAAHPDIEIVYDELPVGGYMSAVMTQLASGSANYDVINFNNSLMSAAVPDGHFVNMSNLIKAKGYNTSGFSPAFSTTVMLDDDSTWWGLPWRGDLKVLLYNTELYAKAGITQPPRTWDDLVAAAKKINNPAAGQYGMIIAGASTFLYDYMVDYLSQAGNPIFKADGTPTFNTPEAVKMINIFKELLTYSPEGTMSYDLATANTAFAQGKTAHLLNWAYAYTLAEDPSQSVVVGKVGTTVPPTVTTFRSRTSGWGLGINSKSKVQDAAFEYIKWATSPEVEKRVIVNGGDCDPVNTVNFSDPDVIKAAPIIASFNEIIKSGEPYAVPKFPELTESRTIIETYLAQAMLGQIEPKAALDRMEREILTAIGK